MQESTVAAISTAAGEGAIGIVRISGENAFSVAQSVFKSVSGKSVKEIPGYTALFGTVYDENGERIDNAVLLKYCAPKSYTGEDVVEISVHGGRLPVKKLLRSVLSNGASLAGPGEFTKRAFLNGKLDLVEAESVMAIIKAQSEQQLKLANSSINGNVSRKIKKIEDSLTFLASSIAVYSDYPEEYLPELDSGNFILTLEENKKELEKLLKDYDTGKKIYDGISAAIVGKPNVGKSTLMNLLLKDNRSIVTKVAGTTRDVIEETVLVGDTLLRLADTAGIHSTDDEVEAIGVSLSKEKIENSDIVLAVFDTSVEIDSDDKELLEMIKDKTVLAVLNKNDKTAYDYRQFLKDIPYVEISAKTGSGTEQLCEKIETMLGTKNFDTNSAVLMGERQRSAADNALNALNQAIEGIKSGITTDAVGICVDDALYSLYKLTGKRVTNEVADEVFRNFCVGK